MNGSRCCGFTNMLGWQRMRVAWLPISSFHSSYHYFIKCFSFYRKPLGKLQTDKSLAYSVLHGRLSFFDNQNTESRRLQQNETFVWMWKYNTGWVVWLSDKLRKTVLFLRALFTEENNRRISFQNNIAIFKSRNKLAAHYLTV